MDHVLRSQVHDNLAIDRKVEIVEATHIVLSRRIVAVKADIVAYDVVYKINVGATEHTVGPWIVNAPRELLRDDPHFEDVSIFGDVHPSAPCRNSESEQQNHLNNNHAAFNIL